jgi:hypothetical protein
MLRRGLLDALSGITQVGAGASSGGDEQRLQAAAKSPTHGAAHKSRLQRRASHHAANATSACRQRACASPGDDVSSHCLACKRLVQPQGLGDDLTKGTPVGAICRERITAELPAIFHFVSSIGDDKTGGVAGGLPTCVASKP